MKATLRSASKACLVTAASGLLCSQVAGLLAEDYRSTGGSAVQQAQAVMLDDDDALVEQQPSPAPAAETEVQKKLREIYKKNGREMPSMNMADLPNTTVPSAPAGGNDQAGSAVTSSKGPKANWFERTFHVGKGKKQATPTAKPLPKPAARTAAPAPGPNRNQMNQPAARPGMPMYRPAAPAVQVYEAPVAPPVPPVVHQPPIGANPNVSAAPARQQYTEPAPLAPMVNPSEPALAAKPPMVRPAKPNGASQPLLDESGIKGDSESLDLDNNSQDTGAGARAPQMLARPATNGPAQSPYSGLKISPNEIEQRADSALSAAPVAAAPIPAVPAVAPTKESPAIAATATQAQSAASKPAAADAKSKDADLGLDDDGDEADDGETISLPAAKPDALLQKPGEPEKMIATTDKPAAGAALKGLKGLCPVTLKDERKLIDAQPGITSEYKGKIYNFSTADAKKAFDENPKKYVPAGGGNDVVQLTSGEKKSVEGTLDHAAWYRGRLYLFASPESRLEFVETPSKFVLED